MNNQSCGFDSGLSSDEITRTFKDAVKKETNRNRKKGLPTARYDAPAEGAYLETADGSREYVDEK